MELEDTIPLPPIILYQPNLAPLSNIGPDEIPPGLTLEEIRNPQNSQTAASLSFLNELAAALEEIKGQFLSSGKIKEYNELNAMWTQAFKQGA